MRTFGSVSDLLSAVDTELEPGEWLTVDQSRIDRFARATDDEQWIHTDPARAATGPFGSTVAHGHLTLALVPALLRTAVAFEGLTTAINYGVDRVRFPVPVPVGSRLRARPRVVEAHEVRAGTTHVVWSTVVELDGAPRPACVATIVTRYVF